MEGEMQPSYLRSLEPTPEVSEQRIHRNIYIVIALATLAGLLWSGWRMAFSIALGGILSLVNERWLRASVKTILGTAAVESGRVPRWAVSKFLLRYAMIAVALCTALWSGNLNLLGISIGFASLVGAVMIEAGYQIYLTFKSGEE